MLKFLVMLTFGNRETLASAVEYIIEHQALKVINTALITRAQDGEVTIFEDDISPKEGAITGGTLGALMGSLGIAGLGAFLLPGIGPIVAIGLGAVAGGLVGGATGGGVAKVVDMGINNQELESLAKQLSNDQVALVLEVETPDVQALKDFEAALNTQFGAVVVHEKEQHETPPAADVLPPSPM
jgi:uncharacterized membrane protein